MTRRSFWFTATKSCLTGRREQLTGQGWKNVLVAEPGVQIDLLPATE